MRFPLPGKILLKLGYYKNNLVFQRFAAILGIDILVKASGFILLPVYLRLMEQEEFGYYNYLISIISTFSLVFNFGLYVSQSKLYHQYNTPAKRGAVTFTIALLLTALLAAIILLALLFKLDYALIDLLFKNKFPYAEFRWILLPALCITIFSFMLTNYFYTSEKIKAVKRYNIYRVILINSLSIMALYFIASNSVKLRIGFTYLAEAVLFVYFARYVWTEIVFKLDKKVITQSFRLGMPIMLSAFFGIFVNFSDKFFIEKYGSPKDLSNYYLAFSFSSIITLVYQSLQNIWLPLFLKEKDLAVNIQKTKKLIVKLIPALIVLGLLIWLLFALMISFHIIPGKYDAGKRILPLLLTTQIIATTSMILANYFVYLDKTYVVSITGLFITIVSLVLNILFVPTYGMYGAIIINLTSNLLYALIYLIWVRSLVKKSLLYNDNSKSS